MHINEARYLKMIQIMYNYCVHLNDEFCLRSVSINFNRDSYFLLSDIEIFIYVIIQNIDSNYFELLLSMREKIEYSRM